MTEKNALVQIKLLAAEALRIPSAVAWSTFGAAKHLTGAALSAGAQLTAAAMRRLEVDPPAMSVETEAVRLAQDIHSPTSPQNSAPGDTEPTMQIDPDKPVNVVDELGLDPAPVTGTRSKPDTAIDAAADPDAVMATPADIATTVQRSSPKT